LGATSELSNRLLNEKDSTIKSLGGIGCRDPSFIASEPALVDGKLRIIEERSSLGEIGLVGCCVLTKTPSDSVKESVASDCIPFIALSADPR